MARKNLSEDAKTPKKESMGKGGSKKTDRLDMAIVEKLKAYQKKRNSELKGTGLYCNLNPKKELKECECCRFFEECKGAKLERKHLCESKHISITAKRKRNSDGKAVMKEEVRGSHEIFEDEIDEPEDAYE